MQGTAPLPQAAGEKEQVSCEKEQAAGEKEEEVGEALRGRRWARAIGPALFFAALGLISYDFIRWWPEYARLARRERLLAIDARYVETDLEDLRRAEALDETPERLADLYWDQLERLAAGTTRAETVKQSRVLARQERLAGRRSRLERLRAEVGSLLAERRPARAAALVLSLPPAAADGPEAAALRRAVRAGLLEQAGLVLVAGGNRSVGRAADRRPVELLPFLIDVRPAGGGLSFREAMAFAARLGRRLPTRAEREASADETVHTMLSTHTLLSTERGASPAQIWEWVAPGVAPGVAPRVAPGVTPANGDPECLAFMTPPPGLEVDGPVAASARRADGAYPDVAFRTAIGLEDALRLESEGKLTPRPAAAPP